MTLETHDSLGVCSWSLGAGNSSELVELTKQVGLKKIQLALGPVRNQPELWADIKSQSTDVGISIVSGMFGAIGEDYSTLQTIRETGGIVPDEHWDENWKNIQSAAKITSQMDLALVSFHVGFIPENPDADTYGRLVERIRLIADLFAQSGCSLMFETGQESAETLLQFLEKVERDNVGINFDPANMILYGMGEPVSALKKLLPHVLQLHIKDALHAEVPGTWGKEVPAGTGDVDFPALIKVLAEGDFTGNLVIEREAGDNRIADVRTAAQYITKIQTTNDKRRRA